MNKKVSCQRINRFTDSTNLVDDIQLLWVLYVTWQRVALIARIFNLPTLFSAQTRAYKIPQDFYNVLKGYFNEEIASQFADFLRNRIVLEHNIVEAMIKNDQKALDANARKYFQNAEELAEFLSQFPRWDESQWKSFLFKDLNMYLEEIRELLLGNYEKEIILFESILKNATEIGQYMARGMRPGNSM